MVCFQIEIIITTQENTKGKKITSDEKILDKSL